jgi:hypothetical protein
MELYQKARMKYGSLGINFYQGDSAEVLPLVAETIQEPVFFYLDAHAWGRPEVAQEKPFPLWAELNYIRSRSFPDIVAIDDYHTFGKAVQLASGEYELQWELLTRDSVLERLGRDRILDYMLCNNAFVVFRKPVLREPWWIF